MSAKCRALQHRHRYTYSAIIFPQYYKQTLADFINSTSFQNNDTCVHVFYSLLNDLVSLNSTYAQLNHAKKFAAAFTELLKTGTETVISTASKFYLEILFLENWVPSHRILVSVLANTREEVWFSSVGLSMTSSPKLGYLVEVVEECAILMGLDVVYGLNSVIFEINDGSRGSPIVTE